MTLPETFLLNPNLHAYLYLSADFGARQEAARLMAMAMLCQNTLDAAPCEACTVCKKVAAKAHPDVIYVSGTEKTSVDDVRKIEDEAYLAPNEASLKVFILENVNDYNIQSQNALLKIIEEPPKGVRFILTASSAGAILPTVRSRVLTINGEAPCISDLARDVKKHKSYLDDSQVLSLSHFCSHFDKSDIKTLDEKSIFDYMNLGADFLSAKETLAIMNLPKKRDDLMLALEVLMLMTYEVTNAKSTGVISNRFVQKSTMSAINSKVSAKRAHALYDVFEESYLQIQAYANINAVLSFIWQNTK